MPVQAVGGVFLATRDPERLISWVENVLDIRMERHDGGASITCGDAVLGVQKARADSSTPPLGAVEREPYGRQPMMANLRVDELDAVVARIHATGSDAVGPEAYAGLGRFAWTRTPDGHDLELWER